MEPDDGQLFADWAQLRQVLCVLVPTTIYALMIPYLGIYVSSIILIALFMKWLGKYPWTTTAAVARTFVVNCLWSWTNSASGGHNRQS